MSTDQGTPILDEFTPRPGLMQVSRVPQTPEEWASKSTQALRNAMSTVEQMVEHVNVTLDNLAGNPDQLEFTFGLKFDFEGNALVAKAGAEAAIGIKVTWMREGRE